MIAAGPLAFSLADLESAAETVHASVAPTPLYAWPLLAQRLGTQVYLKHENHTAAGAFKIRGGVTFVEWLRRERPDVGGVVAATRGNHGQSVALAARRAGLTATIVVPRGNSVEKNAAMRAQGAELIEAGHDFQAALEFATGYARERGLELVPSFHRELVRGVASYALELFRAGVTFDTVYVPIGLGSGICGLIAARDALGLATEIVGATSEGAPAYALSFAAGRAVATERANTFVDGVACRVPVDGAVATIVRGAARVVTVCDDAVRDAMRAIFSDTHNVAEPAGAIAFAAACAERERIAGTTVAAILCGGNVDRDVYARVLASTA